MPEINNDELVEYFVINSELEMSPGKVSAQIGHVATMIAVEHMAPQGHPNKHVFLDWFLKEQKKVILQGKTKDLEKLVAQGFTAIHDVGYNEVPSGSLTCVGLQPMTRADAKPYIKRLQTYK